MNLKINLKTLNQLSILYVSLPVLVFLITWLKPYIAIISSLLFIYAIYCGYFRKKTFYLKDLLNSKNIFITVLLLSALWCYFAGIGAFWYQSNDHHWRNAVFRDLINNSWPIYYKTADVALVYYMGFWLPAALITKICLLAFSRFSTFPQYFSFFIGNELLFIYSTLGLFLIFMNLMFALKVRKIGKVVLAILIFILFSGMDIVGVLFPIFYKDTFSFSNLHLEWWSLYVGQYSSNTTVLFWVFNQGIPAWLLTLVFYNNRKDVGKFGIIALLCFFCAPLPFVGLAIFLIIHFIKDFILKCKKGEFSNYLKKVFSVENIIVILFITPIVFLYLTSNAALSNDSNVFISTKEYSYGRNGDTEFVYFLCLCLYFVFLEVLVYLIPIYKQYKKNIMYYVVFLFLVSWPVIVNQKQTEFCMRSSIPMLVILCLFVTKFLFRKYNFKRAKIRCLFLIVCLIVGSATPIFEFSRGIINVIDRKTIYASADDLKSLEYNIGYNAAGKISESNFLAEFPKEKVFFKRLARK